MWLLLCSQGGIQLDFNGLCSLLQDGSPVPSLVQGLLQVPAPRHLTAAPGVCPARQARMISWGCAGLHVSISAGSEIGYTVSCAGLG